MREDIVLTNKITIGNSQRTFIIAEIGQNHQGDINTAKELIQVAKTAGADCVKFQKTNLAERFTQSALDRPYQSENSFGSSYGKHRAYLELTENAHKLLKSYAEDLDIIYSASAMDEKSLAFLQGLKLPFIKIGSGDANNFPLIEKAAVLKTPLIVSTGMQTFATVQKIYNIISAHHHNFVLMHCVSSYPTKQEDTNLNIIGFYKEKFPKLHVGYSGHEAGCIAHFAVAAGAKVIERHLTLNKSWKGSDHVCSLNPKEFTKMVEDIRKVEMILGKPQKEILPCEIPCRNKLGKSLVASKSIPKGKILKEEDICVKVSHPMGIPAENFPKLIGTKVTKDFEKDEILELEII